MKPITEFSITQENDDVLQSRFVAFIKKYQLNSILHNCKIFKAKGTSPISILTTLLFLPFFGTNIFRSIVINNNSKIKKTPTYEFLACSNYTWRRFLTVIAHKVVTVIDGLTNKKRDSVLIFDDTPIQRQRSKKVELLAKVYDHSEHKFIKGFRNLTLAWSDGASLIPLDFALLSSANEKNRYQNITKTIDKRSCGYKRRQEAITKSTLLLEPMLKRALNAGIKAKYILMDSWFGMPAIISKLRKHLPVICMIKKTSKIFYTYGQKQLSLNGIYRELKKCRGKAKILASCVVTMNDENQARIVFIRDRHKKDWLALLSTDIDLPEADVVRIYGKRWDIEVFFRTAKQHLQLEKGSQARDFDNLIAHTTFAFIRYIFLSLEQRQYDDPRTLGLLFQSCCEEMRDLNFLEALKKLLLTTMNDLYQRQGVALTDCQSIIDEIFKRATQFFNPKKAECQQFLAIAA